MLGERKQTFGNEKAVPNSVIIRGGYDSGGFNDEQIEKTLEILRQPYLLGELVDQIQVRREGIDDIMIISGDPGNTKILEIAVQVFSSL